MISKDAMIYASDFYVPYLNSAAEFSTLKSALTDSRLKAKWWQFPVIPQSFLLWLWSDFSTAKSF